MTATFQRLTSPAGALALLCAFSTSCRGGAQTNTGTTTNTGSSGSVTTGTDQTVANQSAQFDVSEVPAPAELLGLVRATSLRTITNRLVRLGLVPEAQATDISRGLLNEAIGDETIAGLFDPNSPVDGALVWVDQKAELVVGFGVPAMSESARRLGNAYRLNGVGNGVMELVRANAQSSSWEEGGRELHCFLSPTPQTTQARMTCTQGSRGALESVSAFMARTLPRRETRQDAIVATLFPAVARTAFGTQVLQGFDEAEASLARPSASNNSAPLFNHPDVRSSGDRLAREIVANLRAIWNESQGLDLTASVDDNGAHLVGSGDLHTPTGTLVRALTEASRTAPPFPDSHLQRIPTEGGFMGGYSLNLSTFAPFARILDDLLSSIARHTGRIPAAQVQQLQTLVSSITASSNASAIQGMLPDAQNQPIWVSVARCADANGPATMIQSIRAALGLIHQPAIARVIRDFQQDDSLRAVVRLIPDFALIRELPATGLPAGSLLLQIPETRPLTVTAPPPPPTTVQRGRAATRTATPAPTFRQWLFIPEGSTYTTIGARDARAAWTTIAARTGPVIDTAALGLRQGAITLSFTVASLDLLFAAGASGTPYSQSRNIGRMPDQGRTPIVLRFSTSEVDGNTRFQFSLDVQAITLRGFPIM